MNKLVDLSQPIENQMPVYPGDEETKLFQTQYLSRDKYNNHRVEISMHAGTHIDSPMHLTDADEYISEIATESFIGTGCLLDVRNQSVILMKPAYEEVIKAGSIVLLYTGQDQHYGTAKYYEEHPVIDMGFCECLIRKNIRLLGMDMPSPDQYPFLVHKALFKQGICILENLANLDRLLGIRSFEVIAFPLKIKADSSMTRAMARIL